MSDGVRFTLAVFLMLLSPFGGFGQQDRLKETVRVEGRVVAYDGLSGLTWAGDGQTEILVVKVSKVRKGKEESEYIKAHYTHAHYEPTPAKLLDGRLTWRFGLVRLNVCDGKLDDIEYLMIQEGDSPKHKSDVKRLKATEGAEGEKLPMDKTLPCYLLVSSRRVTD